MGSNETRAKPKTAVGRALNLALSVKEIRQRKILSNLRFASHILLYVPFRSGPEPLKLSEIKAEAKTEQEEEGT